MSPIQQELEDLKRLGETLADLESGVGVAAVDGKFWAALLNTILRIDARLDMHVNSEDRHMPGTLE